MSAHKVLLYFFAISIAWNSAAFSADTAKPPPDFFPESVFSNRSDSDAFIRNWFSEQLRALEETSLFLPEQNATTYRFTWLRSFHNPMVFRLNVLEDGSGMLTVKRTNGAGGYKPGVVDLRKEVALSIGLVDDLKKKLDDMSYWEKQTRLESMGMDGAEWIVEASENGKYKIVDRWSDSDSAILAWGLQLIELSGVDVGDVY
jgi:hypothetical protein